MDPFEALYGKRFRSPLCLFQVGEVALIGPELVHKSIEKVDLLEKGLKFLKVNKSHVPMLE